jgi:hypothetical protein
VRRRRRSAHLLRPRARSGQPPGPSTQLSRSLRLLVHDLKSRMRHTVDGAGLLGHEGKSGSDRTSADSTIISFGPAMYRACA